MTSTSPDAPTQVRFSLRAVVRTLVQVVIPTVLGLGAVVPQIVAEVMKEYGDVMPAQLRVTLLAVSGAIAAGAAVLARIMAIPRVETFLRSTRFLRWLSAEPAQPVDITRRLEGYAAGSGPAVTPRE